MLVDLQIKNFKSGPLRDFIEWELCTTTDALNWLGSKVENFDQYQKKSDQVTLELYLQIFLERYVDPIRHKKFPDDFEKPSRRDELVCLQEALRAFKADNPTFKKKPFIKWREDKLRNQFIEDFVDALAVQILPIPNIEVCPVLEVEERLDQNPLITAVLSIEHPDAQDLKGGRAPRLNFKGVEQNIVIFWDVENEKIPQGPDEHNIQECLDFLNRKKDEKTLIHCRAGKSRSVGVALAWVAQERGVKQAIKWMKQHRDNAAPNILAVHHADQLLGLKGALTMAVLKDQEWLDRRTKLRARMRKEYGPNTW